MERDEMKILLWATEADIDVSESKIYDYNSFTSLVTIHRLGNRFLMRLNQYDDKPAWLK